MASKRRLQSQGGIRVQRLPAGPRPPAERTILDVTGEPDAYTGKGGIVGGADATSLVTGATAGGGATGEGTVSGGSFPEYDTPGKIKPDRRGRGHIAQQRRSRVGRRSA